MCGIVGYVGPRPAVELVLEGLKRLEYRGYDSAGIAAIDGDGQLCTRRAEGRISRLEELLAAQPLGGHIAIGHTRWATHGAPSQRNAHPHLDCRGEVAVIQNGIVENFAALRARLLAEGHVFASDTDTEVIVHLIEALLGQGHDLVEAARLAFLQLKGAHAIVVLSRQQPDTLIVARIGNAGGVTVGEGEGEMYVASDIPAILEHTRRMVFLEDREMAVVTAAGARYLTLDGTPVQRKPVEIAWDPISAAKGPYRHFMQKEILEQARSITDTLRGRIDFETGSVSLPEINLTPEMARQLDRVVIAACGTSAYAGLVGKFMIEALARLPVEVDYASEFRYRDPLIDARTLVLAITQSGETADTLAALEEARAKGARTISIVNVVGSMAYRVSDGHILMQTGPEIGVASTKAFTASLVDQLLLAAYLGQARGTLTEADNRRLAQGLAALPQLAGQVLTEGYNDYHTLAQAFHDREHFLFLGRGINYPIALEGALKLKEISYIHAEGYPAGEMKHGPIALIDERMPVVTIAVRDHVHAKMLSQIEQVRARGGTVIALCQADDADVQARADHVLRIPAVDPLITPILAVMPLQLLAYHLAVRRGCDVDQPRNLAKSVTVE
jgi:glucosamine--fructose-6-phosphate aminotransferase (isomerizing)